MTLGQCMAVLRAVRGWTQRELAERLGISASYVALVESGRRRPNAEMRLRIFDALARS